MRAVSWYQSDFELGTLNLKLLILVLRARLELARLSALDPKSSAAANYATSADIVGPQPPSLPQARMKDSRRERRCSAGSLRSGA